jgi:hypothetical protein
LNFNLEVIGYVDHFRQGEQPLLQKRKKSLWNQQPEGMYTRLQCHGGIGLPLSMPSSLMQSKSQLQALRGNEDEASVCGFIVFQSVSWIRYAIMQEHGV